MSHPTFQAAGLPIQVPGPGLVPASNSDLSTTVAHAKPKPIGPDWSTRTAAEAMAAGVNHTVLTKDGYYVPGR